MNEIITKFSYKKPFPILSRNYKFERKKGTIYYPHNIIQIKRKILSLTYFLF